MDAPFHIAYAENVARHPYLCQFAGLGAGMVEQSPQVPLAEQKTRSREVLYVASGIGRIEIDTYRDGALEVSRPDVTPGTVLKLNRNVRYKLQPSPFQDLDVRRTI
ncbi:MAG: hypothetical protein QT00_C0001G0246 [archaeon GW2011_AR5]|nr:MAG: hypothetical protein QT00_C0001G0246 [archaeon GW2011_AR5]